MKVRKTNLQIELKGIIRKTKKTLGIFPEIDAAYLYGSVLARKDYEDIDIALLLSKKARKRWDSILSKLNSKLDQCLKNNCDVHILQKMPDPLKYRIISAGITIFVKDKIHQVRFEARGMSEFLDFNPTYDWLNERLINKIANG